MKAARRFSIALYMVQIVACAAATEAAEPAAKPNVLLIFADDQAAGTIAALGNAHIKTPNLDELAARGTSFDRAYCMGSMIGAVCLPSRTMLLTGRSLFRPPVPSARISGKAKPANADWVLLPRTLGAAGYETFHIGKSGNEFRPGIEAFDHNIVRDDRPVPERTVSSEKHADAVVAFLSSRKKDRPFFIYLAPPVPHDPRVAPEQFMALYDPAKLPLPPAYVPIHPFDNGEMTVRDEKLAPWPRTPEVVRRHRADYYAAITCLDHHIGRVLNCLREQGQLDDTIVIFTSDNGLSVGDHGLFGKQNVYEFGGMHVPMVLAGPRIRKGRTDAMVYLFDLFPTICELTGVPIPKAVDGQSFADVLAGKSDSARSCIFTAYSNCQRAVRDGRWKLIRYPLIGKTQLFDLQADPHERNDLSDVAVHAGKVQEMTAALKRMQQEFGDAAPLSVAEPKPEHWSPPATAPKSKR